MISGSEFLWKNQILEKDLPHFYPFHHLLVLNRAEADLGVKLVERKSGGKQGGGSHLTPEGEDILNRYENFQKEVAEAVKRSFIKNFGNSGES